MEFEPGVTAVDLPRLRGSASSGRWQGFEPVASAVDPPLVRSVPGTRIRRHRRVIGLSGILLFACMFLPAIDACGTVRPYELPPLAPPYLYGLVFALIAMSRTRRRLVHGIAALRGLSVLVIFAGLVVTAITPQIGVPEIALAVGLLVIFGGARARNGEARVAVATIALAAVTMMWFAVWCFDDGALAGVYLSLASAGGLLLGGVLWWRELAARAPRDVPPAVARRRE
jgi:hypothetical protein